MRRLKQSMERGDGRVMCGRLGLHCLNWQKDGTHLTVIHSGKHGTIFVVVIFLPFHARNGLHILLIS